MKTRKLWIALCSALLCAALLCGMIATTAEENNDMELDIPAAETGDSELTLEIDDGAVLSIEDLPDIELDGEALTLEADLAQAEPEAEEVLINPASNDGGAVSANPDAVPLVAAYGGNPLTKVYDCTKYGAYNKDGAVVYVIEALKTIKNDFSLAPAEGYNWVEGHGNVSFKLSLVQQFASADVGNYEFVFRVTLTGDDAAYYALGESLISVPASITPREVVITPRAGLSKVYGKKDPVYKADTWLSKDESSPLHQDIGGLPGYAVPLNTVDGTTKLTITNAAYILEEAKQKGTKFFLGWLTRESGENVGKYRILIGGMDFGSNFTTTVAEEYFTITAKDISDSDVSVDAIDDVKYTGKHRKPKPVVRFNGSVLKAGKDYTVSYSNNKNVGTATVTIKGKGNFTGSRQTTFEIVPKPTAISKLTPATGKITVNWKKISGVTGYQIAYSLESDFSDEVTKTVKGVTKKSLVLKGLKSKTTYYVRIRTYKTVKGKTYHSAWSSAKRTRTK